MFLKHFNLALRSFRRKGVYTATNTAGLAVGMACAILIFIWVQHELTYDRFHPDAERIYRINALSQFGDRENEMLFTAPAFAGALKNELSYVDDAIKIVSSGSRFFSYGSVSDFENGGLRTDPNFFKFFGFKLLKGNSETVLNQADAVVLSESLVQKYFGDEEPLGRIIAIDDESYSVTGVVEDNPGNSYLRYRAIFSTVGNGATSESWDWSGFFTFFKTSGPVPDSQIEEDLNTIASANEKSEFRKNYYFPQKLVDIHLHSNVVGFFWEQFNGDIQNVFLFVAIAVVIMIIACMNYINMAVAHSLKRAKEVGIRKVSGATRPQLIFLYLAESITVSLVAIFLAGLIVELVLPAFGQLVDKSLTFSVLETLNFLVLVLMAFSVGILSGLYPAFFLSSYAPQRALQAKGLGVNQGKNRLGKALIAFQFFVSSALVISTMVIGQQMQYTRNKNLGFDKEHVLMVQTRGEIPDSQSEAFKRALLNTTGVTQVSAGIALGFNIKSLAQPHNFAPVSEGIQTYFALVDHSYLSTMGFNLIAGRNFDLNRPTDAKEAIIINQTAADAYGWDNPIGQTLRFNPITSETRDEEEVEMTVVGVVADYHSTSLKQEISPIVWVMDLNRPLFSATIGYATNDMRQLLGDLEATWKKFVPHRPFEYRFVDDILERMYSSEYKFARVFNFFTSLAIILALIGTVGTFAYHTENRKKEIGIRKVFGASLGKILFLLNRQHSLLILISSLVAVPLAYFGTNSWLSRFEYKINQGLEIYIAGIFALLLVSWLAVSYQAIKSSIVNPSDTLREN